MLKFDFSCCCHESTNVEQNNEYSDVAGIKIPNLSTSDADTEASQSPTQISLVI